MNMEDGGRSYDLRFSENDKMSRDSILRLAMIFDHKLDCNALQTSINRLANLDGWARLAGRLRRKSRFGRLMHYIPDGQLSVSFSHRELDRLMAKEIIVQQLTQKSDSPIHQISQSAKSLMCREVAPKTAKEYLACDETVFSVHVTSFSDGTVVSIGFVHTLADIVGIGDVMKAWMLVYQGNESQIRKPSDSDGYPLTDMHRPERPEEYFLRQKLSRLQECRVFLEQLYDYVTLPSTRRFIRLSAAYVDELRRTAMQAVQKQRGITANEAYLTDGDVLAAWWIHMFVRAKRVKPNRHVYLVQAHNQRNLFAHDTDLRTRPHISNCIGLIPTTIPVKEILEQDLGLTANVIRQNVNKAKTAGQIEAFRRLRQNRFASAAPLFTKSPTKMIIISNWVAGGFSDVHFSEPVVESVVQQGLSYPVQVLPSYEFTPASALGLPTILTKNRSGDYLFTAHFDQLSWGRLDDMCKNAFKRQV